MIIVVDVFAAAGWCGHDHQQSESSSRARSEEKRFVSWKVVGFAVTLITVTVA
jgi:hypothetical protein